MSRERYQDRDRGSKTTGLASSTASVLIAGFWGVVLEGLSEAERDIPGVGRALRDARRGATSEGSDALR
jgi:hypothetical protein